MDGYDTTKMVLTMVKPMNIEIEGDGKKNGQGENNLKTLMKIRFIKTTLKFCIQFVNPLVYCLFSLIYFVSYTE